MGATAFAVKETATVEASQKLKNTPRNVFRTIHMLVGLSFGLLLVAQGLSGAALVWRPELDRLMLPHLTHAGESRSAKSSLDFELAAIKAANPEAKIRAVRIPADSAGSDEWMIQLPAADPSKGAEGQRLTVYTSPMTGLVLGTRGQKRDALQFLIELHHNLLWGKTGRTIQGYLAIATIILALSGLWLWWPAKWTPSRFKPRAAPRPMHYAVGFWFMWPLLTIATTATYFIWRQPIQQAFGVAEKQAAPRGGSPDAKREGEHKAQPVSLDAIVAAAHAAQPAARLTMVRFPEGRGGAFTVMFEAADENYRNAPNSMAVRMTPEGAAQVEKVSLWRDMPRAKRFLEWLPRVHQGEWGGAIARLIWSLTGFMPAVLYVSGFLMWRRRLAVGQ